MKTKKEKKGQERWRKYLIIIRFWKSWRKLFLGDIEIWNGIDIGYSDSVLEGSLYHHFTVWCWESDGEKQNIGLGGRRVNRRSVDFSLLILITIFSTHKYNNKSTLEIY